MSGTPTKGAFVKSRAQDRAELRLRIIEEDHLRRALARDDDIRRNDPGLWERLERRRHEGNREKTELNQRLRAAGCRPVDLEPSLEHRLQALRRLEARNRAEIATLQGEKRELSGKLRRHIPRTVTRMR